MWQLSGIFCFQFVWECGETQKKNEFHLLKTFCLTLLRRRERRCQNKDTIRGTFHASDSDLSNKQNLLEKKCTVLKKISSALSVWFISSWLSLERNSWCWDSQYPLSFLSPLRPLWPLQPGRDTNKERPVTVSRSQRTANIQPSFRSIAPRQYLWQDGWTICQRKLVLLNKIAAYHKTQTTNSLEMDNISSFC